MNLFTHDRDSLCSHSAGQCLWISDSFQWISESVILLATTEIHSTCIHWVRVQLSKTFVHDQDFLLWHSKGSMYDSGNHLVMKKIHCSLVQWVGAWISESFCHDSFLSHSVKQHLNLCNGRNRKVNLKESFKLNDHKWINSLKTNK